MVQATGHGAIQTVATCCPWRIKLQGRRIDDTTGGNAGVEPRLSLIYTETDEKRGYGLSDFVGLVSANAAKVMGLYPKKGALAVGSDADIVVLDPRRRKTVRAAELHEADYSPWEGRDPRGLAIAGHAARQDRRRELSVAKAQVVNHNG
jgi:dihydropyrimidinase